MIEADIKKFLNSLTPNDPQFKPLDQSINELSHLIIDMLKYPYPYIDYATASKSITIPRDMSLKVYAIGQGGTGGFGGNGGGTPQTGGGGAGCAIDQRNYKKGDVIVCDINSARTTVTCSKQGTSMQANAGVGQTGGTATGGNIANYTGGAGGAAITTASSAGTASDGCAGGGGGKYMNNSITAGNGGIGGVSGGNGGDTYSNLTITHSAGLGGNGGLFGGNGGRGNRGQADIRGGTGGNGGSGRIIGGRGGNGGTSWSGGGGLGGHGGNSDTIGGDGGTGGSIEGSSGSGGRGGNGGNSGLCVGGSGGYGGSPNGVGGAAGSNSVGYGSYPSGSAGGYGAMGLVSLTKYPPKANYGGGNYIAGQQGLPIVFIEEVLVT